jgi:hypothetical protein
MIRYLAPAVGYVLLITITQPLAFAAEPAGTTITCPPGSTLSGTSCIPNAPAQSCSATVQEKKLAGAAKTSFLKKCEREASERCEAAATERKLSGAAKQSNIKKCVKEAVGQ